MLYIQNKVAVMSWAATQVSASRNNLDSLWAWLWTNFWLFFVQKSSTIVLFIATLTLIYGDVGHSLKAIA